LGLEHIGGSPDEPNPGAFVREYARQAIESSREWYAASPAADYRVDCETFSPSPVPSTPPGRKTTSFTRNCFPPENPVTVPPSSSFPTGTPNGTARTVSATGFSAWASPSSK